MARILIVEPHDEVRELLARVVARMGHEPVLHERTPASELAGVDVVLVEPGARDGIDVARAAIALGATVVCVSVYPPTDEVRALEPVAYVLKPFSLGDLERALDAAVRARDGVAAV